MKKKLFSLFNKFIFFTPLTFYFGERSLIAYDEGIYALQAKWILENNNWITPMKWGGIVDDRTIGIQFLIALSQKIFGEKFFAIYIPTILFGLLMVWLTYEIHREIINNQFPIFSSLILSTTFLWINYFHMATQDIVFASLTTIGIYASIKSYKTQGIFYFFTTGLWIGLAFMFKTYLVFVPLLAIFPFFWSTKIFLKKYFWIGLFVGFLPFIIWGSLIIQINGWATFSGLYAKLIFLSGDTEFTNPFYYYLWNLTLNSLPWSFFSLIGFLTIQKNNKNLSNYFLTTYPTLVIILLSFFSTKTPYYPLQIMSLLSINAYLGINYILIKKNKVTKFLKKFLFIIFPIFLLLVLIAINFNKSLIKVDEYQINLINIAIIIFSICWLSINNIDKLKSKFILIILGPYLITSLLVQTGNLNDRSKLIRIETQDIVKSKNLSEKKIEVITSGLSNQEDTKKIIKIALFMPKLGNGVNSIKELQANQYAWASIPHEKQDSDKAYNIIYESNILNPWKLIIKK